MCAVLFLIIDMLVSWIATSIMIWLLFLMIKITLKDWSSRLFLFFGGPYNARWGFRVEFGFLNQGFVPSCRAPLPGVWGSGVWVRMSDLKKLTIDNTNNRDVCTFEISENMITTKANCYQKGRPHKESGSTCQSETASLRVSRKKIKSKLINLVANISF